MTDDAVFQYLTGQRRPGQGEVLAALGVVSVVPDAAEVAYGPHPRQLLDLYRPPGGARVTLLYFHAGYWQARDKAEFSAIVPALLAQGLAVAMANYPLCPDVTLPDLVEAASAAVPAVLRLTGGGLLLAGHSAGAHLAVELALRHPAAPIHAVCGLSGVYDLEPLLATPLNDKLRLDSATAAACSPRTRLRTGMPPALFAVGGLETPAFQAQNSRMAAAWTATGSLARTLVVAGTDHFSLLQSAALWNAVGALGR